MGENQELIKAITKKLKKFYEEYKKEYYIQYNKQPDIIFKDYIEKTQKYPQYYLKSIKQKIIVAINNNSVEKMYQELEDYNREQFNDYLIANKYHEIQKGKTY
jgi:hypothetical protein